MSFEARLQELSLDLPEPPKPGGVYKPLVISGNMAYVSGHGPMLKDGSMTTGKVGADLDEEAGYKAARQVGLAILATLRSELGSLDRVKRVVKTLGLVNAAPNFREHPAVINGYSDLMAEVFGPDSGVGARSAIGAGSLPGNITVEIEVILEIE